MSAPLAHHDSNHSTAASVQDPMAQPSRTPTMVTPSPQGPKRSTAGFFDKTPDIAAGRALYMKVAGGGVMMVTLIVFAVLPLYWGALWKAPKPLAGYLVDFDGSTVGQQISQALQSAPVSTIKWHAMPASDFPNGPSDLAQAVKDEKTWIGFSINPGASQQLQAAVASANASYSGTSAITVFGEEARQETAYRSFLRPNIQTTMPMISQRFTEQFVKQLASSSNFTSLASAAPQLVSMPISYTLVNLTPFDQPVATAVTFVGLIYLLILTFFLLNVTFQARLLSGLEAKLSLASVLRLRIGTIFSSYFLISLFFTLLDLAFQLDFSRKFGAGGGFMAVWMINYTGMLALGLALESMLTLLTMRFVGFFLIPWVVVNVSVAVLPIQVQNNVYRYGYAVPFYNVSRAVRTTVFATKNELGMNFGILIAWAVLSLVTMSLFAVFHRNRNEKAAAAAARAEKEQGSKEKEEV